uniref:Soluble lytic murein transglycosylase n=1 Tax=uncultured bacterium CSLF42 TaxID=1091574 RepID=G4WVZ5_9BACT|nr:soluble lytic murein transglycosylase [uncultured bacterium CSLF42]
MSIMPMDYGRPSRPLYSSLLRNWGLTLLVFGLFYFVYSGTAWVWFRPVVHKPLINKYAAEYRFDPLWVMAIIKVESGFAPWAHSHRGALGLMQLLPSTARELAPEIGLNPFHDQDLTNPEINIHLGVYYLSKLQSLFPNDDIAVLAAWNAGPGVTQQWLRGKPALDFEDILYAETRHFVRQVDRTYGWLKIIQGWKHLFGIAHGRG